MAQAVVFDLQGVLVTEQGYVVPGVVEFIATSSAVTEAEISDWICN